MNQDTLKLQSKVGGPVECLGQTFFSDEARRKHFFALLAQNLHAFTLPIGQPTLPYANYFS